MRRNRSQLARLAIFCVGSLSGLLSGCLPGYLRMDIHAPQGLNDSTPLHFLVREVDTQQYRTESYDSVAMLVAQRDASVLRSKVLYAKNKSLTERLWIKPSGKKAVAVYFLFTHPQGPWKMLFEAPIPYTTSVELDPHSIKPKGQGGLTTSEAPGGL